MQPTFNQLAGTSPSLLLCSEDLSENFKVLCSHIQLHGVHNGMLPGLVPLRSVPPHL